MNRALPFADGSMNGGWLLDRLITTTSDRNKPQPTAGFADSEGVARWHTPCIKAGREGGPENEKEVDRGDAAGGNGAVCRDTFFDWSRGGISGLLSAGASGGCGAAAHARTGIHVGGWLLEQRRLDEWLLGASGLRICGAAAGVLC